MAVHMRREIDRLKKQLLEIGTLVEEAVVAAIVAVEEKSTEAAQKVIDHDERIDRGEIEVEEECLKILALYQPVAIDLRFIVAVLKINNDLERIGDLAVNIAERALLLATKNSGPVDFDFHDMAHKALAMLKDSLDALVNIDAKLAYKVLRADEEIDNLNRANYDKVTYAIDHEKHQAKRLIHYLSISRFLERLADHATNIAEDVIYLSTGQIVRHATERAGRGGEQNA